jgi:hypothetical protein
MITGSFNKYPALYGISFIASLKFSLHRVYLKSVLFNIILPSTPGLPSGLFPSGFPIKLLSEYLIFPCELHTLPSHPLDSITPNGI